MGARSADAPPGSQNWAILGKSLLPTMDNSNMSQKKIGTRSWRVLDFWYQNVKKLPISEKDLVSKYQKPLKNETAVEYTLTKLRFNLAEAMQEATERPVKVTKWGQTLALLVSSEHYLFMQTVMNLSFRTIIDAAVKADSFYSGRQCNATISENAFAQAEAFHEEINEFIESISAIGLKRSATLVIDVEGQYRSREFKDFVLLFSWKKRKLRVYGIVER